jgi:chemotaxis protein methyltransferase WspC
VRFIRGNLLDPRVLAGKLSYDAVFCRNLLIYLGAEARASVTGALERLVARDGLLFVGHAETSCFAAAHFAPLDPRGAFHFRKVETGPAVGLVGATVPPPAGVFAPPLVQVTPRKNEPPPAMPEPEHSIEAARKLADRGRLPDAAAMCEQLLRENTASADVYCLLGIVQHGLENLRRAEECFDRAIYLDDRCYDAVVHLALIKEHKGDAAGAEVLRRRAGRIQEQARMP